MADKRDKMWGRPVSKEEVHHALGNVATWEADSRKSALYGNLRYHNRLYMDGIVNYLEYLEKSLENPRGSNTGLVSEEENKKIKEAVNAETRKEIEKYKALLKKFLSGKKKWIIINPVY
ncbi:MAG: hypothetical protein G01um101419_690 [Parcubacteria group bacterium Gr01-1014_19]|nr:MAG: hypothetical protein G01um101419_690 [Parcubacteria group bacterium Gr01-1014_19]